MEINAEPDIAYIVPERAEVGLANILQPWMHYIYSHLNYQRFSAS